MLNGRFGRKILLDLRVIILFGTVIYLNLNYYGFGHLAAALGVPTLGLYGPTSGTLTGCRGPKADFLQGSAPCVPCLNKRCRYKGEPRHWNEAPVTPPCFASLDPERVWQHAAALMSS